MTHLYVRIITLDNPDTALWTYTTVSAVSHLPSVGDAYSFRQSDDRPKEFSGIVTGLAWHYWGQTLEVTVEVNATDWEVSDSVLIKEWDRHRPDVKKVSSPLIDDDDDDESRPFED